MLAFQECDFSAPYSSDSDATFVQKNYSISNSGRILEYWRKGRWKSTFSPQVKTPAVKGYLSSHCSWTLVTSQSFRNVVFQPPFCPCLRIPLIKTTGYRSAGEALTGGIGV